MNKDNIEQKGIHEAKLNIRGQIVTNYSSVFCIFKNIYGIFLIFYSINDQFLISFNIRTNKKENQKIINKSLKDIKHILLYNKRDLFLEVYDDTAQLYIYDCRNFEKIFKLEPSNINILKNCLIKKINLADIDNKLYTLYLAKKKSFLLIKAEVLSSEKGIAIFNNKDYYKIFYFNDNPEFKNYVIVNNDIGIASYNIKNNNDFKEYLDPKCLKYITKNIEVFVLNNIKRIYNLGDDGYVRIWNFEDQILFKKINIENRLLNSFSILDNRFIVFGWDNRNIKIFDINNNKIVKSWDAHAFDIIFIKIIELENKKFFITKGYGSDFMAIWEFINN